MTRLLSLGVVCSVLAWLPSCGTAAVIRVPSDEPTVQAGITAAVVGDTVLVAPGVYHEHGITLKSGVALAGDSQQPSAVVIDAEFWGRICTGTGLDAGTSITGMTFKNGLSGFAPGGAMTFDHCTLHISNVHFVGNAAYGSGGALSCDFSSLTLVDVVFDGNAALLGGQGGAISCFSSDIVLCGARFESNSAALSGGALSSTISELHLDHVVFSGNTAGQDGGAVASGASSPATMEWVTFYRNEAADAGGAVMYSTGSLTLANTTFCENSAGVRGGAIYCYHTSPWLNRVIVAFSTSGGGIYGDNDARPVLACCDVFGNAGGDYLGTAVNQTGLVGNISADPLFCGPTSGDLTIDAGSPCAPASSACGVLVGAWDTGCNWPTAVKSTTWGQLKAMYR